MVRKEQFISFLVIILIISVSVFSNVSAAPGKPPIVMDGGLDNARVGPPSWIKASDGGYTDKVEVTWDSVSGAAYFEIYRNTVINSGSASLLDSPAVSPYSDTTTSPGVYYYYWVKSCESAVECSSFSSEDQGYQGLLHPSGVNASNGDYTDKVSITWSASTGATSYQIWRNTVNISGTAGHIGTAGSTSYENFTTVPGVIYYYWIKACATSGCSAFSNSDSGYRAVPHPTGVSATDGTYTDRVEISWTPSTGAIFYKIWRNTSDTPGGAQITSNTTSNPYSDTTGAPGTQYYYWVVACSSTLCSDYSASDTGFRTLTPPSNVQASDDTYTDKVVISWTAVDGATYYEIWRADSARSGGKIEAIGDKLPGEPTSSPYNDTSAVPGTLYTYWVKACSDVGCSDLSAGDNGSRAIAMDHKTYLPLLIN